jgi:hypothetical protein
MAPDLNDVSAGQVNRRLTQPLGCAVSSILLFAAGLVVAVLLLVPVDQHVSVFGFGSGSGSACANVPLNGLSETGSGSVLMHMRPQTFASTNGQVSVCANQPSLGQRTLTTLTEAPGTVLYLAILVLLWRLLRTVRKAGPFAILVARRLRFLAWFIVAGSLAVAAGESVAQSAFTSTVVTDSVPIVGNAINNVINSLVLPVLIACGLLTLARVIRVGTQMSDDLAGTV